MFLQIKAWKADKKGNLTFRKTARNFNPPMCKAGRITIAEVEEIVEEGEIEPEDVHVSSIYIDRIVKSDKFEKRVERRVLRRDDTLPNEDYLVSEAEQRRDRIAKRAALEFKDGMFGKRATSCHFSNTPVKRLANIQPISALACQCALLASYPMAFPWSCTAKMVFSALVSIRTRTSSIPI